MRVSYGSVRAGQQSKLRKDREREEDELNRMHKEISDLCPGLLHGKRKLRSCLVGSEVFLEGSRHQEQRLWVFIGPARTKGIVNKWRSYNVGRASEEVVIEAIWRIMTRKCFVSI